MGRVAVAVMRSQPLHKGHTGLIGSALDDYDTVILGIGSTGRSREPHDPWPIAVRQQMVRNVFGNRVKIVPLEDIGAEQGANTWCDYVLDKIHALGMPAPTDYFTGSHADAMWYKGRFWHGDDEPPIRMPSRELRMEFYTGDRQLRRLHIRDRELTGIPSATDLRSYISLGSNAWKPWIPAVNHELIESTYPEEFRVKMDR